MTAVPPTVASEDHPDSGDLTSLGYKQELHRGLGPFASFASGFSFVSILTTVFQLFIIGFGFAGPAYIWTWPIVFVGQFCVCLCFAELSARYPIAGAIYQWSRRVSTDPLGWMAGWLMQIGYIISVAAIAMHSAMQIEPRTIALAAPSSEVGEVSVPTIWKPLHTSGSTACRQRAIPDLPALEPPLSTITWVATAPQY